MVGKANIISNTSVELKAEIESQTIEGVSKKALLLLSKTAIGAIWIACEEAKSSGSITLEAGGNAKGKVSFNACSTYLESGGKMVVSAICAPAQPIVAGASLELVLHEGVAYSKATGSEAGGFFVTVKFPAKTKCALTGEEFPVAGTAWIEDGSGKLETEGLAHLAQEGKAAAAALGGLKFGAFGATIDGSANLEVLLGGIMKEFSGLAS